MRFNPAARLHEAARQAGAAEKRLAIGLLVALSAAAIVAGLVIGRTGPEGSDERTVETSFGDVAVGSNGELLSEPHPLTPTDLRALPPDSPQRQVLALVQASQWGDLPSIVEAYPPTVVNRLGVGRISASYSYLRSTLRSRLPRLVRVERDGDRASVTLALLGEETPPYRVSFELERIGGAWQVVDDALLEDGLSAYSEYRRSSE